MTKYREGAIILAGGMDLVPGINYYALRPDVLLYIGELKLDYLKKRATALA